MRILRVEVRPVGDATAGPGDIGERLARPAPDEDRAIAHVSVIEVAVDHVELAVFLRPGLLAPVATAYAVLARRLATDPPLRGWRLPAPPAVEAGHHWWDGEPGQEPGHERGHL